MFAKEIYIRRRSALCGKMGSGLILIPGNMLTPNNYLNNAYYFRQDSSFLYYFGLNTPALVGLIDADSGEVALYGDDFTVEDIIWTGPQPSLREQGAEAGVSNSFPLADLNTPTAIYGNRYFTPHMVSLLSPLALKHIVSLPASSVIARTTPV